MADRISAEKVYSLSIMEGIQEGEIFVDDDNAPSIALLWHYCGFANIAGECNDVFIKEMIYNDLNNSPIGEKRLKEEIIRI